MYFMIMKNEVVGVCCDSDNMKQKQNYKYLSPSFSLLPFISSITTLTTASNCPSQSETAASYDVTVLSTDSTFNTIIKARCTSSGISDCKRARTLLTKLEHLRSDSHTPSSVVDIAVNKETV